MCAKKVAKRLSKAALAKVMREMGKPRVAKSAREKYETLGLLTQLFKKTA